MAQKRKDSGKDNLRWTPEMDEVFMDALLEEMMKGNHPDGTFSTYAYDNVLQAFKNSIGPHITKQHLKNRKKTLSQRFVELYDLFNGLSGFSWNPITKMFEADDPVWNDLIEKKPSAKKWMRTQVLHYDKLYELFGVDRATGKYVESAKDKIKWWEKDGIDGTDVNDHFEGATIMAESAWNFPYDSTNSAANMEFSPPCGNSNQSTATASSKSQKRKAAIDSIEERCEQMTMGIKELVDIMKDGNALHNKSILISERQVAVVEKGLTILEKSRPRHYSEEEVWAELEEIGLQEDQKLKCYFFLCNEERNKRTFFGVPHHVRLQILLKMMTDAGIY